MSSLEVQNKTCLKMSLVYLTYITREASSPVCSEPFISVLFYRINLLEAHCITKCSMSHLP